MASTTMPFPQSLDVELREGLSNDPTSLTHNVSAYIPDLATHKYNAAGRQYQPYVYPRKCRIREHDP